jgi:hypothetical protein
MFGARAAVGTIITTTITVHGFISGVKIEKKDSRLSTARKKVFSFKMV